MGFGMEYGTVGFFGVIIIGLSLLFLYNKNKLKF